MTKELVRHSPQQPEHAEALPHSQRLVILGSRGSGAFNLANQVQQELVEKDLDLPISLTKDFAHVQDAFFGREPQAPSSVPGLPEGQRTTETPKKSGLLDRISAKLVRRAVEATPEPNQTPAEVTPDTIPVGVLIFPEMRQYGPDGSGMTIPTPHEPIAELCEHYGVPYSFVSSEEENPATLGRSIDTILAEPKQLPSAE